MVHMEWAASVADREVLGNKPEALFLPALPSVATRQEMHPLAQLI